MKKSLGSKTLACPTPVWCVGTYDKEGHPNVMTAAWGGICCSQPAAVTVSLRKATYTYDALMERKVYTISIPSDRYAAQADYIGIYSGRDHDKFQETGLTPMRSELVDAPYVKEFPLIIECRIINTLEIGLHTQFVGEIVDVKADEEVLSGEGRILLEQVSPLVYGPGNREYFTVGKAVGQGFRLGKELS